ncbi:MAG: glycosyltransferase [Candidatus Eremiobacteraeota bacterium]|nr:glycosyltransferase [Candidatus Eremiobacteraeota bacterium]
MRVAVDAFNLAADRRGMGRFARAVLEDFGAFEDLTLALIARDERDALGLREEFALETLPLRQAQKQWFDAAWYPWNGMRFEVAPFAVVTMHDAFAFTYPARDFVGRWKEQRPIRRASKLARELTAVSRWSASELARELGVDPSRFSITPPSPDPFFSPVDAQVTEPYVFAVGAPDKRKNVAFLIDAWHTAFPNKEVDLHVAGSLNDADERRAAECGVQRSRPNDVALRDLYGRALVVAVPSIAEGYGLMSVEAMACGAAVIAADAAALPEACDGAAMLLPTDDPQVWSQALRSLAADQQALAELRAKSLARAARIDRTQSARTIAALLRRSL